MILAGGRFGDGGVAVDTWAFDGQHWQALDAGPLPNAPNGGRLLSVPGSALVWTGPAVLEGDRWASNRHTEPVARSNRAAGFEPDLAAVVIAGGAQLTSVCDYTSCSYAYDARQPAPTSVWKNWGWVDVDSGVAPVFIGGSLRWDRANKNLALVGETPVAIVPPNVFFPTEVARSNLAAWSLDGGWSQIPLPSGGPTSMRGVDLAVDSTGSLVAYGGVQSDGGLSGQTWTLNDGGWRLIDVGAPHRNTDGFFGGPARGWQLDLPTGNLVFVSESRTDAWNSGWTAVSGIGTTAVGRLVSADPRSGQVIALGPTSLSRLDGDWTTQVRPELKRSFPNSYSVPDETLSACAAPDGSGERLVVVDTTHIDSSTRVLDFVRGRPRQEFVVPLAAARAPAGAELKHAKVRWLGGASGEGADGGLRPGFALMIRRGGQLTFVDGGSSSPREAPGVAEFEFADSRTLRDWLLSPEGAFWSDVGVSAQSHGVNGQGEAVLTTQAIEFSLSWHRGTP
jgi:hypothetical protein